MAMVCAWQKKASKIVALLLLMLHLFKQCTGLLSPTFYHQSCPTLPDIVSQVVWEDPTLAPGILRLHFHDCFVNGCDGSVLLDDTATIKGEKSAPPNANSLRGFEMIDRIKELVERSCPGIVSCADILAIAARDAVVVSGGPSWDVLFGRLDSRVVSKDLATVSLPSPKFTTDKLIMSFQNKGLTVEDLVALSGGHTFGWARCSSFSYRLYNSELTDRIEPSYLSELHETCPQNSTPRDSFQDSAKDSTGDSYQASSQDSIDATQNEFGAFLDKESEYNFDNNYFSNILNGRALLGSDEQLGINGTALIQSLVHKFATDKEAFWASFSSAMISMGNLKPTSKAAV